MPDGALILLLALELENDGFLAPAVRDNRTLHQRSAHRGASLHGFAVEYRQDFVELDFRANISGNGFNLQKFARSGAILLPARFDDCVHTNTLLWILLKILRTYSLLQVGE